MAKLSSYQKLKKQLKIANERITKLNNAITDNDFRVLEEVKVLTRAGRELEHSLWYGKRKTEEKI